MRLATFMGALASLALIGLLAACGSGGGGTSISTSGSGSGLSSCASGTGTLATNVGNTATVVVNSGPSACTCTTAEASSGCTVGSAIGSVNIGYVTLQVCLRGTSTCQTVDHVMLDTGSSGLRLMASAFNAVPVTSYGSVQTNGSALMECEQFADGYSWGTVRIADVKIGGEFASAQNVEIIGDSKAGTPPSACSGTGTEMDDAFAFGANGVLGVGLYINDCATNETCQIGQGLYYNCTTVSAAAATPSTCAESNVASNQQVANPVAAFGTDSNGVIVEMPSVAAGGDSSLTGTLVFGINTESNNLTSTQTVYLANSGADCTPTQCLAGDFYSSFPAGTYTGTGNVFANSFFDSGSNGIFLPGTTIPCDNTYNWFVPTGNVSLSASIQGEAASLSAPGGVQTGTVGNLSFAIANATTLFASSNVVFSDLGGPVSACSNSVGSGTSSSDNGGIDWGMPIFYGNNIFIGLETKSIVFGGTSQPGPLWAL